MYKKIQYFIDKIKIILIYILHVISLIVYFKLFVECNDISLCLCTNSHCQDEFNEAVHSISPYPNSVWIMKSVFFKDFRDNNESYW